MVELNYKREIRLAYGMGYKIYKESDVDVEDIMKILESKDYFESSTIDFLVEKKVREKLEKLYIKNGYNPYFAHELNLGKRAIP